MNCMRACQRRLSGRICSIPNIRSTCSIHPEQPGRPKGILHTTGGYLLQCTMTMKWVFDLQEKDVYWCTADIGWVTGHSYVVYGPLAAGATYIDL